MTDSIGDKPNSSMPKGISELKIQNALAKAHQCDALKLTSCVIERITKDGDNFCSNIYSVNVKYMKQANASIQYEEKLLLKMLLPELGDFSSNEIMMYEQVLPEMAKILQNANNLKQLKLNANCLYIDVGGATEVYLMENLNALGYVSADRCKGLDVQHAHVLLRKMAIFHAAGMILQQQQPELIAKLYQSHYAKITENSLGQTIAHDAAEFATNVISTWPGYETIARKMQKQLPYFSKIMQQLVLPANSKFNVLAHGDLWLNNALFSYEADKPSDVIFVDFQMCFLGTPAVDLNLFFYTSVQLEVLQTQHAALLQFYYEKLQETLKHLQHSDLLPTYELFTQEMKRSEFYAYYAAVCELPLCCMDKKTSENFNIATFDDKEALYKKRELLYANERVVTFLRYVLKKFDALGVLDLSVTATTTDL